MGCPFSFRVVLIKSTIRQIADGEQYVVPSTIDDPSSLGEIERVLKRG
ncbi:propionyl-CoA synthetase [Vibrio owensii]|nr:propionyl-CoA synthetase [Vibrio owensii]